MIKILVCVCTVPDTTSKLSLTEDQKDFSKENIQFIINPFDEYGLNKSIDLKESGEATIDVICVGDESTEPIIKKCLALGVDNAIRVNANPQNPIQVAELIADFVKENPYDIIFMGKENIQYQGGTVGGYTAALLDLPFFNYVVALNKVGEKYQIKIDMEEQIETYEISTPIILGGQKGLVTDEQLRIPNMRGIIQARSKNIQIVEPKQPNKENWEIEKYEILDLKKECLMVETVDEFAKQLQNKI